MEKASGQEERGQDSHLVSANKQFGALSKLLGLQCPHFYKEVFGFTNNFFQLQNAIHYGCLLFIL